MSKIERYLVFTRRRVGKSRNKSVDVARIYLASPGRGRPFFEARVSKEVVKNALDSLGLKYEDEGDVMVLYGEDIDEKIRRLVVFTGVRQTTDSFIGGELVELVSSMGEVEILFWFSRFIDAYDNGGYWDVYRVAKSFKVLYRI